MNTITLTKTKYQEILRNQSDFVRELRQLKSAVKIALADEVTDRVKARLEKQSKIMDRGGGKRFKSMRAFSQYLKGL
ncbi:MAG: hypothetical protein AAB677_03325 [Patescibacteria group bacterium]